MISGQRLLCPCTVVLLGLLLLLVGGKSNPCGSWKFYGSSCYKFVQVRTTWYNANESCQSENAFLVTIDNFEENQFLRSISAGNAFWIGLNDISQERQFVWVSNSKSSYRRWRYGEPNNANNPGYPNGEDCAYMLKLSLPTYWNDHPCSYPTSYVCERGPVCNDWTVFSYSCYKFFDHPTQLDSAENICLNHSGHLTSINSIKENEFVTNLAGQDVWLGLKSDSSIRWLDGSPVTYINWNGSNHADEFGVLQSGGTQSGEWEYVSNNASFSYVCKRGYRCANLTTPIDGNISEHKVTVGSTTTFSCDVGYYLVGNSTITCQSNSLWSSVTPSCKLVVCGEFSALLNGKVHVINRTYQSRVNFTCDDGYDLVGSSSAVCLANGTWSDELPQCRIIDCRELPSFLNGKVHVMNTTYQSRVNFTCDDGYDLVGSSSAVCLANGTWSDELPRCRIIDCREHPSFLNGKVHVMNTTYQSRVNFTCDDGYDLVGVSYAVCLANGTWSDEIPRCISPVCHDWTVFNYSCYKFFEHSLQSTLADAICRNQGGNVASINSIKENEFLTGLVDQDVWLGLSVDPVNDTAVVSWVDGSPVTYTNWSESDPSYQHQLGILRVGGAQTGRWEYVSYNTSFPYVCKKGYRCATLKTPIHGSISEHNTTVGSTASFNCTVGYNLLGNSTIACQSNSLWTSITPSCKIVDCGELPTLVNGKVHVINTTYRSRVNFTCQDGYDLIGASSAVCLANGLWSNQMPVCTSVDVNEIKNTTSVLGVANTVNNLSPDNYTSEIAEAVVTKLENLTASQKLTSSQVDNTANVLESLVTLQEKVLEGGGNLSLSDEYIDTYVEVSGNLLSTETTDSWLDLDSDKGAPAFLESMERFGRVIAFSTAPEGTETHNFSSDNVVLMISTVSKSTLRDLVFHVDVRETNGTNSASRSTVRLPSASLSQLLNRNGSSQLAAFSLVFKNLQEFMPPNTMKTSSTLLESVGDLRNKSDQLPGTSIVSLSIVETGTQYNSSSAKLTLKEPVEINYTTSIENGRYTCSFWLFGSNSDTGFWSSSGVTTDVLSDTNILCSSSHLTSFSVLVAVQDPAVSDTLSYITKVGCGISLACLSLTLFCLICFRRHLHPEKNFIHINFVIALMLALVFFLVGIDQSSNKEACRAMTVIMHYLFLAVFCWMLCEGIFLYLLLIVVFDSGKTYSRRFFALGWGLPVVIVAISFGTRFDDYGNFDYCFLTQRNGLIYAFVAPMIAILLANLIVFIIALRITVSKVSDLKGQVAAVKSGLRAAAVLMPILGLTWVVGVFAIDSLSVPLAYIFTILNSLQGVFVLIFHCVLDRKVQTAFRKTQRRWTIDRSLFTSKTSTGGRRSTSTIPANSTMSTVSTIATNKEDTSSPSATVTGPFPISEYSSSVKEKDSKFFVEEENVTSVESSGYRWAPGKLKWRRCFSLSSYDNSCTDTSALELNDETMAANH